MSDPFVGLGLPDRQFSAGAAPTRQQQGRQQPSGQFTGVPVGPQAGVEPSLNDPRYQFAQSTGPQWIGGVEPASETLRQTSPFLDAEAVNAYLEGDEWKLFRGKSQEWIMSVQKNLIDAGLIDPESTDYNPGYWTAGSAKAIRQVLIYANQEGVQWTTALARIKSSEELARELGLRDGSEDFVEGQFQPGVFRPPSQETARAVVREMIRQVAGDRFINDDLVNKYVRELRADYRKAFEEDEGVRRRNFEVSEEERSAAFEGRQARGMPEAEFETTDPIALFQEKLNTRFQFLRESEQNREAAERAGNSLNSLFSSITTAVRAGSPGGQQTGMSF